MTANIKTIEDAVKNFKEMGGNAFILIGMIPRRDVDTPDTASPKVYSNLGSEADLLHALKKVVQMYDEGQMTDLDLLEKMFSGRQNPDKVSDHSKDALNYLMNNTHGIKTGDALLNYKLDIVSQQLKTLIEWAGRQGYGKQS